MTQEARDELEQIVIIKFLTWYEELDPLERTIWERCLGKIIKGLK
jgi:hypothetical protein